MKTILMGLKKLKSTQGSFTIETVIVFWVVFMLTMVSFSFMAFEYQKAKLAQEAHTALNHVNENREVSVETSFEVLGSDGVLSKEIYRESNSVNLKWRLFFLRVLRDGYERVK